MKYFQPKSLTWWAAFVPLLMGLSAALEPIHTSAAVTQIIDNMTGGASPYVLINAGLAGIGLRGAIK
jgi:hypothetical protein